MFCIILSLLMLTSLVSTQECDLSWAKNCIEEFVKKLETEPLEEYCNLANYTVNVCLNNILNNQDCTKKYPQYSFYKVWLKPFNAVVDKFCSLDIQHLQVYSPCLREDFFTCLRDDVRVSNTIGIVELITSQMVPTVCSEINLHTQMCLLFDNDKRCQQFSQITLDLIKEFIQSSTCEEQPAIVVPLSLDKKVSSEDTDCSQELGVLQKCFGPVLELKNMQQTPRPLYRFCSSANETLSCLVDLLLNGCGTNEQHIVYHEWLDILSTMHQEFCDSKYDSIQFDSCWVEYYSCLQHSKAIALMEDVLFNVVNPDTCTMVMDQMESCLLNTKLDCQDKLEEIINDLRNKFGSITPCEQGTNGVSEISDKQKTGYILLLSLPLLLRSK